MFVYISKRFETFSKYCTTFSKGFQDNWNNRKITKVLQKPDEIDWENLMITSFNSWSKTLILAFEANSALSSQIGLFDKVWNFINILNCIYFFKGSRKSSMCSISSAGSSTNGSPHHQLGQNNHHQFHHHNNKGSSSSGIGKKLREINFFRKKSKQNFNFTKKIFREINF